MNFLQQIAHCLLILISVTLGAYRRERYDKRVNVFDSNGELLQVQYADIASMQGELLIAAINADGNVLVCKQKTKQGVLLRSSTDHKISKINDSVYVAYSGLLSDAKSLLSKAREYVSRIKSALDADAGITALATKLSELQHSSTLAVGERPYGLNIILLGYDPPNASPKLFCMNASGNIRQSKGAIAIGKNSERALEQLENFFSCEMSEKDMIALFKRIMLTCCDTTNRNNAEFDIFRLKKEGDLLTLPLL